MADSVAGRGSAAAVPDAGRLAEYLAGRLPGPAGPAEVAPLGGGQSNPTYLLTLGGRRYALRTKPARAAELLPSAHQIEREYRVLGALAGSGVPVPAVHHLCTDEDIVGRAFFVMDFVPGRVYADPRLPELTADERGRLFDDMNRVLALLHGLDWRALGLADFGKPGDYLARQIARWSKQYQAGAAERIPAMDRLLEWLPQHLPDGEETCLAHGDFRLDNVIFHPNRPRVLAVLDWELSTLGHPLSDFAYQVMAWRLTSTEFRGLKGFDLAALGIPDESAYVDAYCRRTGRSAIADWEFYLIFNMFRIAAILHGVHSRALQGNAASQNAIEQGSRARLVADVAWSMAQRNN